MANNTLGYSFPGGSVVKNLPVNARDAGVVPQLGRSPGGGNGNPLQYSCLENPLDRGAWRAGVHEVTKSDVTEHTRTQKEAQRVSVSCTSLHRL